MGLKLTLTENQNFMGTEFKDAYWKITNFGLGEYNGDYIVSIKLSAYPSREASIKADNMEEVGSINVFGASARPIYEPVLYEWNAMFPVSAIYPEGIPSDMDQAKTTAYSFIKEYLSEVPFTDVFEEGQNTGGTDGIQD